MKVEYFDINKNFILEREIPNNYVLRKPVNTSDKDSYGNAFTFARLVTTKDGDFLRVIYPYSKNNSQEVSNLNDSRSIVVASDIRAMRKYFGLLQEDLARLADLSHSYISQIERGVTPLSQKAFLQIVTALWFEENDIAITPENITQSFDVNDMIKEITDSVVRIAKTKDIKTLSLTRDILHDIEKNFCNKNN